MGACLVSRRLGASPSIWAVGEQVVHDGAEILFGVCGSQIVANCPSDILRSRFNHSITFSLAFLRTLDLQPCQYTHDVEREGTHDIFLGAFSYIRSAVRRTQSPNRWREQRGKKAGQDTSRWTTSPRSYFTITRESGTHPHNRPSRSSGAAAAGPQSPSVPAGSNSSERGHDGRHPTTSTSHRLRLARCTQFAHPRPFRNLSPTPLHLPLLLHREQSPSSPPSPPPFHCLQAV